MISSYPLQWPVGRARTQYRKPGGQLLQMPQSRVRQLLSFELRKMGVSEFVVSTNVAVRRDGMPYAKQPQVEDPGVVLYFTRKQQDIALSCDRWESVDANLRAIGLTVEAIRGMERWGTEEMIDRAFTGFKALPETTIITPYTARTWWEVLQVAEDADWDIIEMAYKRKLHKVHPDKGGNTAAFEELQNAFKQAKESRA